MAHHDQEHERESVLADTLKGAVAGGIAVWVMDQVDWYMYNHEDPEARQRTQRVRPDGLDPAHVMAHKVAGAFGAELSPRQPHPAGIAVHYSLGIGPGALYGALQGRVPALGVGRGALFGLGLFLMQDELVNAATGLSARPRQYPWQAHARGLIAHIVYGIVTDTLLRVLKGPSRSTRYAHDEQGQPWSNRPDRTRLAEKEHFNDYRQGPPSRSDATEDVRAGRMTH
ncbi:hypothetical protein ACETIH_23000 [Microvirga arabica]|uniref:DUF1440 domain-containing protein n=1 Tax=Microvirga arabica TaxID=1128671 RepID=A0ABV6YEC5_9HYPH